MDNAQLDGQCQGARVCGGNSPATKFINPMMRSILELTQGSIVEKYAVFMLTIKHMKAIHSVLTSTLQYPR